MAVATEAVHGAGTTLGYKIGAATVYTKLTQLIETTSPSADIAEISTTKLSSAAHSSIPGLTNNGEVTLSCFAVQGDTTIQQLQAFGQAPAICAWQIMKSDGSSSTTGSTQTFSAWLKSYQEKGHAIDGTPIVDVTLKVTGPVAYAAGS